MKITTIFLWLFTHFIFISAEALGIKDTVPAYLKPDLQNDDLLTGVGFASGGSGIDPLTSSTLVSIFYIYLFGHKRSPFFNLALSQFSIQTFNCYI